MSKPFEVELGGTVYRPEFDMNAVISVQRELKQDPQDLFQRLRAGNLNRIEQLDVMRALVWASLTTDCGMRGIPHPPIVKVGLWLSQEPEKIALAIEKIGGGGSEFEGQLAPFVPTPAAVVAKMIELAEIKPGMRAVDLGAGDGRLLFAAAEAGAIATGYEKHEGRYKALAAEVAKRKLGGTVTVVSVDIREASLGDADVVFMYLLPGSNAELKAKLLKEMKPGSVVVSHDFDMPEWEAETVEAVRDGGRGHTVYTFRIPG